MAKYLNKTSEIYAKFRETLKVRESINRTVEVTGKTRAEVCEDLGYSEESLFAKLTTD